MVTKADPPNKPNGIQPLQKMPKIEPAKVASGNAFPGKPMVNPTDAEPKTFKLPNKVTTEEIRDGSFKYGGGRSAGSMDE